MMKVKHHLTPTESGAAEGGARGSRGAEPHWPTPLRFAKGSGLRGCEAAEAQP